MIKASEHCCEEASLLSGSLYLPCNVPATKVVRWKGRTDKPVRMCDGCTDHNVRHRGGEVVGDYDKRTGGVFLKDCPFCGDHAQTTSVQDGRVATCSTCGAKGPPKFSPDAERKAVDAWNGRVASDED